LLELAVNHRQIEAFKAVMESGSMSAAARTLGISQPNISRFIAALEKSTGLRLFNRVSGKVFPTDDAMSFYHEVERSFVGLRQLKQTASDIRTFGHGRLRIATFPAFAHGLLPKVVRRFHDIYPRVTLSIQTRSSSTILIWAAAQQIDVGVVADISGAENVVSDSLADFEGVCIVPQEHPLARQKVIRPQDLQGERFISLAAQDPARHIIDSTFDKAKVDRIAAIETQLGTNVCALVAEGLGVSVVNPIIADSYRDRGVAIRRFVPVVTFASKLIYSPNRRTSRLADKFISLLKVCCDEQARKLRQLTH